MINYKFLTSSTYVISSRFYDLYRYNIGQFQVTVYNVLLINGRRV